MLTTHNQHNAQSSKADNTAHSLVKSSLFLAGALAIGLVAGCSSNNETNTDAQAEPEVSAEVAPTASEAETSDAVITSDNVQEPVAEEPVAEEAEPEAEAEAPETDAAAAPNDSAPLAADAGEKLYETKCKQCHEPGLLGAPKFGDQAAWADRIAKGRDTLHKHSAEGFNSMPAQADDNASVAEVYAAVDYMIEHSS